MTNRVAELPYDFDQFCATHPYQRITVGAVGWDCVVGGPDGEALLLLPGGFSRGQTSFQYIRAFEGRYRIVAPTYPAYSTVAALLDGLVGVLDRLGIQTAHVVGGSFSGLVAQALVRHYPYRVQSLILTDTDAPSPRRGLGWRLTLPLAQHLPMPLVRWGMQATIRAFVRQMPEQGGFWRAHFEERIAQVTRQEVVSHFRLGLELDADPCFVLRDLVGWQGRVLIIEAGADGLFAPKQRDALHWLYPQAHVCRLNDLGHTASLVKADVYISKILSFLDVAPSK